MFDDSPFGRVVWRGTESASIVETQQLLEARVIASEVVSEHGLTALVGSPGLGKTLTLADIYARLRCKKHVIVPPNHVSAKTFVCMLLTDLGVAFNPSWDAHRLIDTLLLPALAAVDRAIFVDEVHLIGGDGLMVIRYCWTQSGNKAGFILGGEKAGDLLSRNEAIRSRIEEPIFFRPLTKDESMVALRAYHPLFATASPAALERIHGRTQGNFRQMAIVLKKCLRRQVPGDLALTTEILDVVLGRGRS